MIARTDIVDRVSEWVLRENVIENDHVIGWGLWGIGANPRLSSKGWVFKGNIRLKWRERGL